MMITLSTSLKSAKHICLPVLNYWKLCFYALLSCCLSFPSLSSTTASAILNETSLMPSDSLMVTLMLDDAPSGTSWGQLLRFDLQKLRYESYSKGTIDIFIPDSRTVAEINASGEVRTGGFNFTPLTAGRDGSLVVITFTVIGLRTSTLLDVVAKNDDEPFGCVFLHNGGSVIPSVQDMSISIGGGTNREIRLSVEQAGELVQIVATVNPEHDFASNNAGQEIFNQLAAEIDYLFSLMLPSDG